VSLKLRAIFSLLSLSALNFEETLKVAIKQGGKAEAATSGVIKTIDNMINLSLFLVAEGFSQGEMVKESDILITIL
jgi:hypothetical protein